MKAKFTFQVESTVFDATPDEVNRIAPRWANKKEKSLRVLVYIGKKWHTYKTFSPQEAD